MKEEIQRTKIRQLQDKVDALINDRDFWKCSARQGRKAFYAVKAENGSLQKEVKSLNDERNYWRDSAFFWHQSSIKNADRLFDFRQACIDALSASQ